MYGWYGFICSLYRFIGIKLCPIRVDGKAALDFCDSGLNSGVML